MEEISHLLLAIDNYETNKVEKFLTKDLMLKFQKEFILR